MACSSCSKRRRTSPNTHTTNPAEYDLTGGMDIRSLNDRQIRARLEVFKRKFCTNCSNRYECDYVSYVACKGANPK